MRYLAYLALLLASLLRVEAASSAIVGGVRRNYDTTGTNTTTSAVTISGGAGTNLYAGTLNATNSVNVGQTGEQGVVTLTSTNGTYSVTLSLGSDGTLQVKYGTTNMLTLLVGSGANNDGAATNFLSAAGYYTNPPASVTINTTDGVLPKRTNATTLADSHISEATSTTNITLNGRVYQVGQNRMGIDFETANVNGYADTGITGIVGITDKSIDGSGTQLIELNGVNSDPNINTESVMSVTVVPGTGTNAVAVVKSLNSTNIYYWRTVADVNLTDSSAGSSTRFEFVNSGPGGSTPLLFLPMATSGTAYRLFSGSALSSGYIAAIGNVSTQYYGFGPTGVMEFGPGTTNVLYRNSADLIYTNGAASPSVIIKNGAADSLTMSIGGSGIGAVSASGGYLALGGSGSQQLAVASTSIQPVVSNYDIGAATSSGQFRDLHLNRYVVWNGTTNSVFDGAGSGSPAGVLNWGGGSTYRRFDGPPWFYVNEGGGTGNWVAK